MVALFTIATLLALPSSAFGAKGTGLKATLETRTDKVSVGNLLAFQVGFENTGKSAIQHFRFDGSITGAGSATYHGASHPACGAGASSNAVDCQFGSLAAGSNVDFVILFTAASTGTVQFAGEFSGDARTGTPGRKQDIWATDDTAGDAEIFPTGDFYGGWQLNLGAQTFPTVGTTQKTTLTVPAQAAAYAVALGHSNANVVCGSTTITGYGRAVEVSVANGKSPITLTIELVRQPGLNANTVKVVHESDDGSCTFPPRVAGCLTSSAAECYDARTVGNGNNQRVVVDVKLESNGKAKAW
jgi:hypothetical protein